MENVFLLEQMDEFTITMLHQILSDYQFGNYSKNKQKSLVLVYKFLAHVAIEC